MEETQAQKMVNQIIKQEMSKEWFEALGHLMCGNQHGWQKEFAKRVGISSGIVSKILQGWNISPFIKSKVIAAAQEAGIEVDLSQDPPKLPENASPEMMAEVAELAGLDDLELIMQMRERFSMLEMMVNGVIEGTFPALIVSGPPGVGKTWPIREMLRNAEMTLGIESTFITGKIKPTNLFLQLWEHRHSGILVLDDCDSVWHDGDGLNILKGALDTTGVRNISWATEWSYLREHEIPKSFEFNGKVIFITNLNIRNLSMGDTRLAESIKAVVSRSVPIPLGMYSQRELVLRIEDMVLNEKILRRHDPEDICDNKLEKEIVAFFKDNADDLQRYGELSLRTAVKVLRIATLAKKNGHTYTAPGDVPLWWNIAQMTLCR